MTRLQLVCVCAALVAGAAVATVVVHRPCEEYSQDVCTVEQVRIDPCNDPKACKLKKGSPASLVFDFRPNFTATKMKTGLFGATSSGDVPFSDLFEADACQFTACPVESGKLQQLTYNLVLGKLLPQGTFEFKFKLWNADDANQMCCFKTKVKVRK